MILVDVHIASIDKTYDFKLDENTKIQVLVEEIAEMVAEKESMEFEGSSSMLFVCVPKDNKLLALNRTLNDYNIKNGDYLMLI